jgi:UDP-N-acetylglucosamine 4,6-dehydratase
MKIFKNKIVLITGGTGSFGSTFLIYLLKTKVKEIRIFSRDEKKQEDLRLKYSNSKIKFYIGDIRDFDALDRALHNVDFVFHAAALKQVPSCEFYPMEAVKTNILGTNNLVSACVKNNVKKVIGLSTDKAVYPINAMGVSKAMMEKILISKARTLKGKTCFCVTRYGNVMTSRGSVIPLFVSQIKRNNPLTITDPNMTRFLMSLDESVDLVLHAFKYGKPGDLFVQKAPAATIHNLANSIMKIFKTKVPIKIIGTRHGEKLYESLLTREELAKAKSKGKYYVVKMDARDLNYGKYFFKGQISTSESNDYTSHNTKRLNNKELEVLLKKIKVKNL